MAVLTVNADVLAGRSLAAYCCVLPVRKHRGLLLVHVGRSLATTCWCFLGCARSEAGLVCLRPSERSESVPPLFADRGSGVERSAKLASPARARAEQCRYLPRAFGESVGSVKPGLLFFPDEERSDEVLSVTPPQERVDLWSECLWYGENAGAA